MVIEDEDYPLSIISLQPFDSKLVRTDFVFLLSLFSSSYLVLQEDTFPAQKSEASKEVMDYGDLKQNCDISPHTPKVPEKAVSRCTELSSKYGESSHSMKLSKTKKIESNVKNKGRPEEENWRERRSSPSMTSHQMLATQNYKWSGADSAQG